MEQSIYENLDRFADMIEPACKLMVDPVVSHPPKGITKAKQAALIIKNQKETVVELLAASEGVPVEEYEASVAELTLKVLRLLNMPETRELFMPQGQKKGSDSSGSVTELIRADEN